ncbi:helix-turn-helix transcriptional regulator [Variovorax sp. GT1P44]|uniref:helix-turn-helix transcriptional regulator n=1 Tax=Variovorax sp. GT1P44 TaxID=3443742 RepID=UPI003F46101A
MTNIPRLRELREFHGESQKQLAAVLDVASRTILRWEAGDQDPNLSDLRKLAAHYGVTVAYLVGEASK